MRYDKREPQVMEFPLSPRRTAVRFDSGLGYVLTPEKADAMRRALAFVWAVKNENWSDAGEMMRSMIDGSDKQDPVTNFANAMGVMATLLCNEVEVTAEWVGRRVEVINYFETHPDEML